MASRTGQTETRRLINKARLGKKGKNHVRKYGTTKPGLPLNKPNANERAQAAARS